MSKEKREKIVCGCKGDCARKICGCKKAGRLCDRAYCECSADKCKNKSPDDDEKNDFTSVETVTIEKGDIPNLDVSTIGLGSHRDTVNFEVFKTFFHLISHCGLGRLKLAPISNEKVSPTQNAISKQIFVKYEYFLI